MSAVKEYRKVAAHIKADSVYGEHRGMGMLCSPVAHQCQEMADAAISELEAKRDEETVARIVANKRIAELEKRLERYEDGLGAKDHFLIRAEQAEAELARERSNRADEHKALLLAAAHVNTLAEMLAALMASGKAQLCPVCGGRGQLDVLDAYKNTACNSTKPCHGCGGSGWVTV